MGVRLDVNLKTTTTLPLKPLFDKEGEPLFNGFTPARLIEVNVRTEEHKTGEYNGLEVPVLNFVFMNYPLKVNEPERRNILSIKPPFTQKKQGEDMVVMEEDVITDGIINNWKKVKHVLDNLKDSPNFKSIEGLTTKQQTDYLTLPGSEIAPDERVKAYRKHYEFIAEFVNGKGGTPSMLEHPKYKDGYPMFAKLIAITRTSTNGKKYQAYDFPYYLGSGMLEAMKFDAKNHPLPPVALEFKPSESIVISNTLTNTPSVDNSIPTPSQSANDVLKGVGLDY